MSPALSRLPAALLLSSLRLAISIPYQTFAAGIPTAATAQRSWTINLKEADIQEFIEQVAQITGETFVIDPRVKGQVSVISSTPLSRSEVYQLFLSVLTTHGFSIITQDDQARIIPSAEAHAQANAGPSAPDNLETRLIQVQQGSAAELIPLIRPLMPQNSHLASVSSSNALIISDSHANIQRIQKLITQLDEQGAHDYSIATLQHAWVMDAAEILNSSIQRGQPQGSAGTQVIADARTNRLILLGPADARAKLLSMARLLDTPTTRSANTRVIRLRHNDARALAKTLGKISESLKGQASGV